MCAVHRKATQVIFQRKNIKSYFVEQKLKQDVWDAHTALAVQVHPQPYAGAPIRYYEPIGLWLNMPRAVFIAISIL